MVICLERGADLHMAQLMSLPLTVSCFSKIPIGLTFVVPAHTGSPGQRAVKRVCVCVCVSQGRNFINAMSFGKASCTSSTNGSGSIYFVSCQTHGRPFISDKLI